MNSILKIGSIVLCTLLLACGSEPVEETTDVNVAEVIVGRWEIVEGLREGKPAESLSQLFFEFTDAGSMNTNLSGAYESCSYLVDTKSIKPQNCRINTNYLIEGITDSTLNVSTTINNYDFFFKLKKVVQEK